MIFVNIVNVLVINSNKKYKLGFNDDQLDEVSKMLVRPSERGMVNYMDKDTIEALDTSNKYYISGDDNTKAYQLDILKSLLIGIENTPILKSTNDVFDDGGLKYTLVGYLSKEDNGNQELFLYRLKETNLVKDSGFWIFKKKNAASKSNSVKIEQVDTGFNLPVSDCLASIYKRKDSNEGKQYKAKIFDKIFQTVETQHKYVDRTLEKFASTSDPIKLLKDDKVTVSFEKSNLDRLKQVIYSDDHLTKTFATFHDNKKRIIKQIDLQKLKDVLDTLKDYIQNNADAGFELKNIPVLNSSNKLEVTEDSVPTFAALLDNKVIQRLLSNKIEIPYFKRHS
jgi:hypothetical protein